MSIIKFKKKETIDSGQIKNEFPLNEVETFPNETLHNEKVKIYKEKNGMKKAVIYAHPTNYFDSKKNKWIEIDNTLIENDESYFNERENHKITFSKNLNKKGVKYEGDNFSFEWAFLGRKNNLNKNLKACKLHLNSNGNNFSKATYQDVDDFTDLEYIMVGNDVKENIIVKSKSEKYIYSFQINVDNLSLRLSEDEKTIELVSDDVVKGKIPSPYMYDSTGKISDSVYYELEQLADNKYLFDIVADEEWINREDTILPITIDPQIKMNEENVFEINVYNKMNEGSWVHTKSDTIEIFKSNFMQKKTSLTVRKKMIPNLSGTIESVILVLPPVNTFNTTILIDTSSVKVNSQLGNFRYDITDMYLKSTNDFSINFLPYTTGDVRFCSFNYQPRLEITYIPNETITCKKTVNLAKMVSGDIDLKTGNMITSIYDIEPQNSVMNLEIYHIYRQSSEDFLVGKNWRLNIHETFKRYSNETFIHTDSAGTKQCFNQLFYYYDSENKVYVDRENVVVDSDGDLEYVTESNRYKVYSEYKSPTGLTALTTLAGVKNVEFYEQRQEKIIELENKIKSYKDVLSEYSYLEVPDFYSEINVSVEDHYHAIVPENHYLEPDIPSLGEILDDKEKVKEFLENDDCEQFPVTNAQKEEIKRLLFDIEILECDSHLSFWQIGSLRLENNKLAVELNNLRSQGLEYTSSYSDLNELININNDSAICISNRDSCRIESYGSYYIYKIQEILNTKEETLQFLKTAYSEYCRLQEELEKVKFETPVCFLTDNKTYKGYNEYGNLVIIFDIYENQTILEYEKVFVDKDNFVNRISRIYDSKNKLVTFNYENNLLVFITDAKGNNVHFNYDENNLISNVSYSNGYLLEIQYSENEIYSLYDKSNELITYIEYSFGRLYEISYRSLVNEIPSASYSSNLLSYLKFEYIDRSSKPYGVESTSVITSDYTEIYKFDENSFNNMYLLIKEGVVTQAEKYSYTPFFEGTVVQSDPHYSIIKTVKSSLYCNLDEFVFVDGDTEYSILNESDKPKVKTIGPIHISRWTEDGITYDNYQTTTINYLYDKNQRLIKETKVISFSNPEKEYSIEKIYNYNLFGDIVKIKEYVVGEENVSGVNITEYEYDSLGHLIKSCMYNTLDPSSKLYSERSVNSENLVESEYDLAGNYETKYKYFNNSPLNYETILPNGVKVGYGYDSLGRLISLSQSTLDGEENSVHKKYIYDSIVEMNSNNTNVKLTYNNKRKLSSISVDDIDDYVTFTHQENVNSTTGSTNYVTGILYKGRLPHFFEKNGDGQLLSKSLHTASSKYLQNQYSNGKLVSSNDIYNHVVYGWDRDILDRIERCYSSEKQYLEQYYYNEFSLIKSKTVDGVTYNYTYKDNVNHELESINVNNLTILPYYDMLHRYKGKDIVNGAISKERVSYYKFGDHTTNLISSITYNEKDTIKYTYDNIGNISKVYDNGELAIRYTYDGLNRLTREDNKYLSKTTVFSYDNNGNITKKREYNFTLKDDLYLEELDSLDSIYEYENNRLVKYNNKLCAYDDNGRITSFLGNTLSWNMFIHLTKIGSNTFTYDSWGRRTKKNSIEFEYDNNGNLIEAGEIKFIYDIQGVCGFIYNSTTYTYRKNALGDVVGIVDTTGQVVVKYLYDAWGNHVVVTPEGVEITDSNHIGNKNPIRYRGYYYDVETRLFYCNSRYYSPELCRFISPDSIEYLDPESINGLNLYCYCFNNPIMYVDPSGHSAWLIIGLLAGSFALGFGASVVGQGFSHGWNEINYWQAGLDGVIALGTTALSFTGIPAWGMALVGAGTGFGQYAMDCGFHNEKMTWLGAGTATVLGGVFGFAGGPGVRNSGAITKNMVGLSDDGARAIGAITTAANRRFFGEISEKGMQATLNLYSRTAFNAVQAAIPGTIRHLMIKSIAPGIILPIANLITSIGIGHVYKRLGWC